MDILARLFGDQRADIGVPVHRVADFQRLKFLKEQRLVVLIDILVNDEALGGDAGLAVIDGARLHADLGGFLQIRGRHDDEGVRTAKLQHGFLDFGAGGSGDGGARGLGPGQGGRLDALILQDTLDPVRADQKGGEGAVLEAGLFENFFDRQRASGNVRGVFQHAGIARHQGRRGKPDDLPEREIPRHHRQNRAKRQVAHEGF